MGQGPFIVPLTAIQSEVNGVRDELHRALRYE